MLELYYKEKRTLVDFRRGPLGPYFDGFAAFLQAKGYARNGAQTVLGKCCQFNGYLLAQNVSCVTRIQEAHVESFLSLYFAHTRSPVGRYSPEASVRRALKHLLVYLVGSKVLQPRAPKRVVKPYSWLLDPYERHLRRECQFSEKTVKKCVTEIRSLLECMGRRCHKRSFTVLSAESIEKFVKHFLQKSTDTEKVASILRRFFGYCALKRYTQTDFSALVPTIRRYRHSSLPKGIEDSVLERVLQSIQRDTPEGARDYAIMTLMMAYGIRGISAAQLSLEDLDWQCSRIRIRAQKGGKEVVLPLMQAVGHALIAYLQHRPGQTQQRNVFLATKAPYGPLDSGAISQIARRAFRNAGIKQTGYGSRSFRHSWAIRALAHDSPIKAIADVLGHRYIDTTYIYAKADLKSLRQVALPWPVKD